MNCKVVGLVKQLQLQLFSVTRTRVLKPKVRVSVTDAGTKVEIACGYGTLFTYNCTLTSVAASGVANPST